MRVDLATMSSARAFLSGIVDYAGLFPPASLGMREAVREYATHFSGGDGDLLGRFVVPAARLDEFSGAAEALLPREPGATPWRLSVIAGSDAAAARENALHFNCSHWTASPIGHAVCDAIEIPVKSPDDAASALRSFPANFQLFLEFPLEPDAEPLIAVIEGTSAAAKFRAGGVTEGAIPTSPQVARFIGACVRREVRFKATAGLHHAVRGVYPLTYERNAPKAMMHGYLNVFLAAAFAKADLGEPELIRLLDETDSSAFRIEDDGVSWRDNALNAAQLADTRESVALSFGSCSFAEPVAEARELGLL